MLRSKGLSEKVILLGIDGMDPKFSRKMVDEGYMPNLKKLIERGATRHDLRLLGGVPTITPPMWTTLCTGAYPMTHGVEDFQIAMKGELDVNFAGIYSKYVKAQQLWNVTAESGKKTLVWHWPGGAWPPSSDSENLYVVDGTSPGAMGNSTHKRDDEVVIIATAKAQNGGFMPYGAPDSHVDCDFSEVPYPQLHFAKCDYKDPRIQENYQKYVVDNGCIFQDYDPGKGGIRNGVFWEGSNMFHLANMPVPVSNQRG